MNANEISSVIKKYEMLLATLLKGEFLQFNSTKFRATLPEQGGVYHIVERINDLFDTVYIGQSNNLQNRIYRSHLMGNRQVSTLKNKLIKTGIFPNEVAVKNYLYERCMVQFLVIENESDRNSFEHFAISILRPKFND